MLTNFFSTTKPANSMFILALFIGYILVGFFTGSVAIINFTLIGCFFVLFAIVNFVNSKNDLTFDNSYFFLFYIFILGYFPETYKINTYFYANLTLTLSIRKIYSFQSSNNILKKLFDSGFWIGISFLIEPFTLLFSPLIFIAIFIHQHIDVKRLFSPIIGFVVPLILSFTYCFWHDSVNDFYMLFNWSTNYDFSIYNTNRYLIIFSLLFLLVLIAAILKGPKTLRIKNIFRKSWIVMCLHFLFSLLLILVLKNRNGSEVLFLIFPSALLIANGFELLQKKWFADIIILIILSGSLLTYFL